MRVSGWAKNPRGYGFATLVGVYVDTQFGRDGTALAVTRTDGDVVKRLELVMTADELEQLVRQGQECLRQMGR